MPSVACPSPSAPICTNLTIQATRPPPVNEQTRKYPLLVLTPPNLRQSQCEQVTLRAPWEIRRTDLDAEPIPRIIDRLRRTGKLILQGGCAEGQLALFAENRGDDNARHHE